MFIFVKYAMAGTSATSAKTEGVTSRTGGGCGAYSAVPVNGFNLIRPCKDFLQGH